MQNNCEFRSYTSLNFHFNNVHTIRFFSIIWNKCTVGSNKNKNKIYIPTTWYILKLQACHIVFYTSYWPSLHVLLYYLLYNQLRQSLNLFNSKFFLVRSELAIIQPDLHILYIILNSIQRKCI